VSKNITNKDLLKKVLSDFNKYIEENGNWFKELENFHNKVEWITIEDNFYLLDNNKEIPKNTTLSFKREPKYIENRPLKELAKEIEKNYENIKLIDIYNLIPQILRNIYNFLWFKIENINVDYYYIINWYINFIPNNPKPSNFSDYENNLDFFEEIIFKTLDKVGDEYKKFEFEFIFKIPFKIVSRKEKINIDDRIKIYYTDDNILTIEWKYKYWYILEKFYKAFKDLTLIINILELNKIFIIKDINKWFWRYIENYSCEEYDKNNFKYSNIIDHQYGLNISYFQEHLSKFNYSIIWNIDLKYFYLLSDKINNTNLITASNFFGTELKRFDSQIFLSHWQAIEIMLWSPEKDIKNELKNKFELFFPKNSSDIDILWNDRCAIVHNWKISIDEKNIKLVTDISKKLFLKLIVSNYF